MIASLDWAAISRGEIRGPNPKLVRRLARCWFRDTILGTWMSTTRLANMVSVTTTSCTRSTLRFWQPSRTTARCYLGPEKSGNLLEVVTVRRDDATEIVIHAMKMRRMYEPLLHEVGGTHD